MSETNKKFFLKILARDCRSDDTKVFYGYHNPDQKYIKLYRRGKIRMIFDRMIPDDILEKKIISKGTSIYELEET